MVIVIRSCNIIKQGKMQYQMKNINSKSFKQYQQNPTSSSKRAISPFLGSNQPQPQTSNNTNNPNPNNNNSTTHSNQKSKKKISANSPYQRAMKQFESYGKAERKKISNFVDADTGKQQHNKFRIVTEPVDDRIMHLAQSNIFNSSLANKNIGNAYGNRKVDGEPVQIGNSGQIRVNLRQSTNQSQQKSRQRIYTHMNRNYGQTEQSSKSGERYNHYSNQRNSKDRYKQSQREKDRDREKSNRRDRDIDAGGSGKCRGCARYAEELEYLTIQIKKIVKSRELWRAGEITYEEIQEIYSTRNSKNSTLYTQIKKNDQITVAKSIERQKQPQLQSPYTHNSLQNIHKPLPQFSHQSHTFKFADTILNQIKSSLSTLITQIQSLTSIDYPKMLQMQIFKYEPTYSEFIDAHQTELKELFGKLRAGIEGKITDYDTCDCDSQNTYVRKIMVNLKSRLGSCLRENLELRICKAIYEKSQEISEESEEYLRKVIQEVIQNYVEKPRYKDKDKQKQKDKEKTKSGKRQK